LKKLVQRFANAEAVGQVCQGFTKPIMAYQEAVVLVI